MVNDTIIFTSPIPEPTNPSQRRNTPMFWRLSKYLSLLVELSLTRNKSYVSFGEFNPNDLEPTNYFHICYYDYIVHRPMTGMIRKRGSLLLTE